MSPQVMRPYLTSGCARSSTGTHYWSTLFVVLSFIPWIISAQNITDEQLNLILARLAEGATQSWEIGTRAQALTELNAPFYSVFSETSLPPPRSPPSSVAGSTNLTDVLNIAAMTVAGLGSGPNNATPQALIAADGAAGDPASLGVAVLLANWTGFQPSSSQSSHNAARFADNVSQNSTNATNATTTASTTSHSSSVTSSSSSTTNAPTPLVTASGPLNFAGAAQNQLNYLLTVVPRTSDGAISHRVSEVQLWADFIYMVPPFLAYYGVLTNNQTIVTEAYNQIMLYRKYLRDPDANNVWRHIDLGTGAADSGHWSTGNGWAAAGTLRVLASIKNSQFANQFKSEQNDLKNWVIEILNGMYGNINTSGLFPNYATNSTTFEDASSTALLAASTYRLAVLEGVYHNLPQAEKSRMVLSTSNHITSDGWLTPVVNPIDWTTQGSQSPEGQAFVVEMTAAHKDWVAIGSPGANGALGFRPAFSKTLYIFSHLAFLAWLLS